MHGETLKYRTITSPFVLYSCETVFHTAGGTQASGVREKGAEGDIQAYEGQGKRGVKKSKLCGASRSVPLAKYSGDQIQKNEMGGSCSTYRGEKRCIQDFGGETFGKEDTWNTQV